MNDPENQASADAAEGGVGPDVPVAGGAMPNGGNAASAVTAHTPAEMDEIDKRGHPLAASHALILHSEELKGFNPSPTKIRAYLDTYMSKTDLGVPSIPTIMRILRGLAGSYVSVNWVFTALSAEWGNLSRERFVAVGDRTGQKAIDPNFSYCLVFPRLATLMAELKINHLDLSRISFVDRQTEIDLVGASILVPGGQPKIVKPDYIVKARRGYPIRSDKVHAMLNALNSQFKANLSAQLELFS